jgi:F-type H+-transporting ATPase subunit b
MTIDWWTLGLQTINLLVLVALLGHFLLKPLAAIVAARQAEAQRLLDEAASARIRLRAKARLSTQSATNSRPKKLRRSPLQKLSAGTAQGPARWSARRSRYGARGSRSQGRAPSRRSGQ